MYQKENSPFDVNLKCNINIEINVAMRLGELIYASRTEDKQLRALGYRLSNAMKHLTDSLDDKQWDRLSDYMEDQSSESSSEEDYYSHRAQNAMKEISSNTQEGYENSQPLNNARNFRGKNSRRTESKYEQFNSEQVGQQQPISKEELDAQIKSQRDWAGWCYNNKE